MSESQEFQNIKTELEKESRSLNEEREKLEKKVKMLREKVTTEELRKSNAATRDAISQLKVEINELEQKLGETTGTAASVQQPQEATSETIATLNPKAPIAQQVVPKKQDEKKRRTFF